MIKYEDWLANHPALQSSQQQQAASTSNGRGTNSYARTAYQERQQAQQALSGQAKNSTVAYQGGEVSPWQTTMNIINDLVGLGKKDSPAPDTSSDNTGYFGSETSYTKTPKMVAERDAELARQNEVNALKEQGYDTFRLFGKEYALGKKDENFPTDGSFKDKVSFNWQRFADGISNIGQFFDDAKDIASSLPTPDPTAVQKSMDSTKAAKDLSERFGIDTADIEGSKTAANLRKMSDDAASMSYGEKLGANALGTAANYAANLTNAALVGADALSGGKISDGDGAWSSLFSLTDFAGEGVQGLTQARAQAMRDNTNWLGKVVLDLEGLAVEQILDRVLGGGSGLVPMALRTVGAGAQEGEDKGLGLAGQVGLGLSRAGVETGLEALAGIGGSWRGTGYGERAFQLLDSWIAKKTNSELLGTLVSAYGSEALEEMLADVANPILDRIFKISDGDESFLESVWGDGAILYDGFIGGLVGSLGGAGTYTGNRASAKGMGVDIATYKAAERIASNKDLRDKFENFTGVQLSDNESTAITQIAATLTEATNESYTARDFESGLNAPQNVSESAGDIQSPPSTPNASTKAPDVLNSGIQPQSPIDIVMEVATGQKNAAVNGAGYGQGRERVRGYETNVASSKVTDPELAVRVERDLNTYKQLGNADTLKKAQSIMLQGLPTAQAELQKALGAAKGGAKLSPEMVPLSRLVANELTRNGDVETARQIIADVAVELTAAGQLGQAGRIMRTADPATALDSIRKALNKINTEFSQRMPNSQWMAELTAEEEQLIANTDFTQDGAFEQVYDQIARRIGAEMPVSMWNKLTELRRINMLLRPRSLIKNVVSNVPMKGLRKGAENLSAAIQKALPPEMRTRGFASDEQKVLAREYYTEHEKEILEQGDRWDINSLIRKYKTVFKGKNENKLTKELSKLSDKEVENVMEGLRQLTYTALEKGDARFVRSAFVDSLSQYMAAQGINSADGITQEAVDFAMANALEATFKSANVVATALNTIKRNASPATAMALDVLFPFTTTPTNILIQTGKYSPVGLVSGVVNMVTQGANASNIDALSKGAVGSALIALGWALRNMDIITGGEDEDKDKAALDKATGNNTYSIGGKVSYDWAQPVGSLLALGAEISDAVSEQESWASAFVNALYTAGDSVLNMSLFQNVLSVLKGSGATKNIFDTIMEGGATQLIPGLAGDIARIIDGTVRSTYTGGNVFNDAAAKMQANIPFASKNLPASINVKGEANTRGGLLERTVNTLANPANVSQGKRTVADEEIYRILEETGSKTHFPSVSPYSVEFDGEKFKMNGEERARFQTTQGQAYYSVVDELIQNAVYKNADVDVQRKILETVRDYSLAAAKSEFLEGKDKEYIWPNKTIENASILEDPATYLAALATMKASQEKTGGTFDSDSADVFKGYITAGLNNDDLSTLSENLSSTNKESYDTLTAQFGQDEANRIFTQVQTKDIYGDQTSAVEKGSQINVIPGLSDAQKVAVLEAYTPPDKDTGKRKTAVLGYEAALNNDISFSQWTGILEELDEYDETQGNDNGQYNKSEFRGALEGGTLDRLGVDMGWWNVRNLYNDAAEMTDAYDESAIEPKKPKVPSRAFRYDPKGIYKILGLSG